MIKVNRLSILTIFVFISLISLIGLASAAYYNDYNNYNTNIQYLNSNSHMYSNGYSNTYKDDFATITSSAYSNYNDANSERYLNVQNINSGYSSSPGYHRVFYMRNCYHDECFPRYQYQQIDYDYYSPHYSNSNLNSNFYNAYYSQPYPASSQPNYVVYQRAPIMTYDFYYNHMY